MSRDELLLMPLRRFCISEECTLTKHGEPIDHEAILTFLVASKPHAGIENKGKWGGMSSTFASQPQSVHAMTAEATTLRSALSS